MEQKKEIYFARILSLTLTVFAMLILPLLVWSSFFMRRKIEEAYDKWGRDETIKLINIWGIFGLITILFRSGSKKKEN